MKQVTEGAKALGLDYIPSFGNFVSFRVGNAAGVFQRLLKPGVIVRPIGGCYGCRTTCASRSVSRRTRAFSTASSSVA